MFIFVNVLIICENSIILMTEYGSYTLQVHLLDTWFQCTVDMQLLSTFLYLFKLVGFNNKIHLLQSLKLSFFVSDTPI